MSSPAVTVPSAAERPADDDAHKVNGHIVADFSEESPFAGTLSSAYALLNGGGVGQRPGCQQAASDVAGHAVTIEDGANYSDIFPTNQIPLECLDPTAVDLLQFVPLPSAASNLNLIQTVPVQPTRGDQFTVKLDHRINDKQNLSFYYYFDDTPRIVRHLRSFKRSGRMPRNFGSINKER
jgi:hypothetical protein